MNSPFRSAQKVRFRTVPAFTLIGFGVLGVVLLLFFMQPVLLRQIDLNIYDQYMLRHAGGEPAPVTLIVDIDEQSLGTHGQWPWPRYRLALLIERLLESGAATVALDILLAEPDRTSPNRMQQSLRKELGLEITLDGIPEELRDNDVLLASSIAGAPVILGGYVRFDSSSDSPGTLSSQTTEANNPAKTAAPHTVKAPLPPGLSLAERSTPDAQPALPGLSAGTDFLTPVPTLAASPVAFFNMALDQDGLVRRIPLLLRVEDRVYANLSLRALMMALGAKTLRLTSGVDGLESIGVGTYNIPVTPDGSMLLRYRGQGKTFPYLSAGRILDGDFDPAQVQGRIVFIGTSAAGLLDIRSTPPDRYMPGVEVHANIVDAALSQRSVLIPPWNAGLQILLMAGMGLGCLLLCALLRPVLAVSACALLAAGCYAGGDALFVRGFFVTPLWSMLTAGAEGLSVVAVRLWLAERDKRQIRKVFSRYVSPEVVARIVDRGETVLRGEERELTIMFTDLRGFTSLSERLSPQEVVTLLNKYFTPMTALVRSSQGTLDKFIGDALMALWNAPLDVLEHPAKAVETALAMQEALTVLNVEVEQLHGFRLGMGAGIHTGLAHIGNMGSDDLTSYTAIGDSVNLASRLEGLCSRYGVPIVLSGETAARVGSGVVLQQLGRLRVKGRREPVDVFTAMREQEAETRKQELLDYTAAREHYLCATSEHDSTALAHTRIAFETLCAQFPAHPLYRQYLTSCQELSEDPPQQWTDVWTLQSK